MPIPNFHQDSIATAQVRAASLRMGMPHTMFPTQSVLAAVAKHGGLYTLLDSELMTARLGALLPANTSQAETTALVAKLQSNAEYFFYKLVDQPGYTVHSELIAFISEPGNGNGVAYDEGEQPSQHVPAVFTFVGQFVDHDLTFNGMNLTADESDVVVEDEASPLIDLDSVYGPRKNAPAYKKIFDGQGKFRLHEVKNHRGELCGYDVPRHSDPDKPGAALAYIFDPRNDENQLILQIHLLVERLHNKIRDDARFAAKIAALPDPTDPKQVIQCVRREVVATWQSFLLNDYMPAVLQASELSYVLTEIHKKATDVNHPEAQYGSLKHKPYRDLVTGKNVVRMPHEFAIGFRFGHSQLRPAYLLNNHHLVLLFKDARHSDQVQIGGTTITVSGRDDLRGSRPLTCEHVIDWNVFYPRMLQDVNKSMLIDHNVTARVFNLPESAIPDDIKYIGNLPHRNLLRGSQIGVVSGEELARFYGYTPISPADVMGDQNREAVRKLFELDSTPGSDGNKAFKTPLWYYLLKEAEVQTGGSQLGQTGSRLLAEVLAGAIYYGNEFPYDDNWTSTIFPANKITLHQIVDYVNS